MADMRRYSDWNETIPLDKERKKEEVSHEYSGLIGNITNEIGVLDVIDFGCGDGSLCSIFSKSAYLGLDVNEEILKKAQSAFDGYAFKKHNDEIYSTDLCIVSKVFSELSEESIHDILKRMRCKWLLVVEPLKEKEKHVNIYPFHARNRDGYVKLMRTHDLLLIKHMIKTVTKDESEEVSFLLFKKALRNPIL